MTKKSGSMGPILFRPMPPGSTVCSPRIAALFHRTSEPRPARLAAHTRSRQQLGSNIQVRRVGGYRGASQAPCLHFGEDER